MLARGVMIGFDLLLYRSEGEIEGLVVGLSSLLAEYENALVLSPGIRYKTDLTK